MKCSVCARGDNTHDQGCWRDQVSQLTTAVARLLGIVEDPCNMSKNGWDKAYEANRFAHRVLVERSRSGILQ